MPAPAPSRVPHRIRRRARAVALAALAAGLVAACDPPLETLYPPERALLTVDGRDYRVTGRFDPFQRAWYANVTPAHGTMDALSREAAEALVADGFGPQVCGEGGRLAPVPGVWGFVTDAQPATPRPSLGGWQIVARCA